jgi:Fic family protein
MSSDLKWPGVQPLPQLNGDIGALLATIDDQRRVWEETLKLATETEFAEARKRSLRRHAIETGIIERLYDVDWGVTQALVAEGLTVEAAEHEGAISEETLDVIRSQYSALEYLAQAALGESPLSLHFIRELHDLITRHQSTYEAKDQFGRVVQVPLVHGAWKTQPNHAIRDDGARVEFAPPEQVQSAMQTLLDQYEEAAASHPIVRAAWLHHRFVLIHPFADGNGRVARALTLLVLLQSHYAPLVISRHQRTEYIDSIDQANSGDLRALVRLFARSEGIALRSELIRPVEAVPSGGALEVARAYAERLRDLNADRNEAKSKQTVELADALHRLLIDHLNGVRPQLQDAFRLADSAASVALYEAAPGSEHGSYWRAQLIRTANAVDFYTNLRDGSWWTNLRLLVMGQTLRYVVAIQRVGRGDTGVLAVTVFAESLDQTGEGDEKRPTKLLHPDPDDSVTLVYGDDANSRWPEVVQLVDRTLAAAIATFSNGLG